MFFVSSCGNVNDNTDERFMLLKNFVADTNNCASWSDSITDAPNEVLYTLEVKNNKTLILKGITKYPYNSGIEMEDKYTIIFVFGSEKDNKITYSITMETIMHKLKDEFNYSPYIMDEYKLVDSKAILNTTNFVATCYYESLYSKNNLFSYSKPNEVLERISKDCFINVNQYFENRIGISLFL